MVADGGEVCLVDALWDGLRQEDMPVEDVELIIDYIRLAVSTVEGADLSMETFVAALPAVSVAINRLDASVYRPHTGH